MPQLREQAPPSKPRLSSLRQRLRRPHTWLGITGALALLAGADSFRAPQHQVTVEVYILAVRAYQALGRPLLKGHVQCRYCPTCSEYSIQAVRTHGIRHGMVLTWNRVSSCRANVPPGTDDPVPPADP
jgi:uncharacterized protein